MSDLNKEALDVWGALKPMIDQEISSRTQGMVQRRKAKVTTAPSLTTNTIGVTEAFGDEMFLPFVSNMISAKVGDFVWIEWMYGATNAFVSSFAAVDDKNVSVAGVLDVVPRRCNATLSSAGWYRVLTYTGASDARALGANGDIYDFSITRKRNDGNNEVHKITLLNPYNVFKFVDESSVSNSQFVTKIRVTGNSTTYTKCVDIYYDSTRVNPVTVDFILHSAPDTQGNCVASGLTAVSDTPSGETILTTYDLHANGDYTNTDLTVDGVLDVVPRRCSAALSSAGWYRAIKIPSSYGSIRIRIQRAWTNTAPEVHNIDLLICYNNAGYTAKWVNEASVSYSDSHVIVDKIRCTRSTSFDGFYVDIHYNSSSSNTPVVTFDASTTNKYGNTVSAESLQSVADNPSGETIFATYDFHANSYANQLCCYSSSLSGAGWYRVFRCGWASGSCINVSIGVNSREYRDVKCVFDTGTSFLFCSETSKSVTSPVIDKIRAVVDSTNNYVYIDVHHAVSTSNPVIVMLVPCGDIVRRELMGISWSKMQTYDFVSVGESPASPETVRATYNFAANTNVARTAFTPTFSGTANPSVSNVACYYSIKDGVMYAGGRFNLASFTSGSTTVLFTLPVSLGIADRGAETIGTVFTATKTLQLRSYGADVYITDAGGNYSGGLLNTGYWSFQIVAPIYN